MLFFPSSSSFNLPPAPVFSDEQSESCPPKSPLRSPPHTSPTVAPPSPGGSVETKHDVPYFRYFSYCLVFQKRTPFFFLFLLKTFSFKCFRSEMANETERLMSLSLHWESKVEDESIPEESEFIFYTNWLLKPWIFNFGSVDSGCFSWGKWWISLTNSNFVIFFLIVFSERSHAHSCWPSTAVDERTLQPIQRSGGRLWARPRGEDHHLHWPAGVLGHGLLPGDASRGATHTLTRKQGEVT